MLKITTPRLPEEKKFIFTAGIDYFQSGRDSIWGAEDKDTLHLLKKTEMRGRWLNLAAGDGRYNLALLKKVDSLTVADIDESALSKLWHTTPVEYRSKLGINIFDLTKKFPFESSSFDGIFSTGILHLFPKEIFKKIFKEIDRILKPRGRLIMDFATDMKRTGLDGKSITFGDGPNYTLEEAEVFLKEVFKDYKIRVYKSEVPPQSVKGNPSYTFTCKFIILVADKK